MTSPAGLAAMPTQRLGLLLTWRYLLECARRPLNLVLLAVVPVIFVTLSAGAIADFADVLGGFTDLGTIEAAGASALVATTRPAPVTTARLPRGWRRAGVALRFGFRDYRRNLVLWVLLVALPVTFITLSIAVTPDDPTPVELVERGSRDLRLLSMSDLHGAIMVPITVGFLAGLAGLFVALGSAERDRRLVLAGYRPLEVLAGRLGVIVTAVLLTTGVSLAVTGFSFVPQSWAVFALASVLTALTYGMIGVLAGPRLGLLGGLYVMLALPFIDIGIAQNAMFDAAPPAWAEFMPAHGAVRVLLDGAFTASLDETGALGLAFVWLAGLTALAARQFHRFAAPRR